LIEVFFIILCIFPTVFFFFFFYIVFARLSHFIKEPAEPATKQRQRAWQNPINSYFLREKRKPARRVSERGPAWHCGQHCVGRKYFSDRILSRNFIVIYRPIDPRATDFVGGLECLQRRSAAYFPYQANVVMLPVLGPSPYKRGHFNI